MKKIFTILCLSLFFISQTGYFIFYSVSRRSLYNNLETYVLSTVPEKECQVIDFSSLPGNVEWLEKGDVFVLNNVMYDVARRKLENGHLYLYCITETKESEIINDLSLKFSDPAQNGKSLTLATPDLYFNLSGQRDLEKWICPKPVYATQEVALVSTPSAIVVPPPRV